MAQTIPAGGARIHVFAAVDHGNGGGIGLHAAFGANRWEAPGTVRQAVGRHFGPAGADVALGLKRRHDLGPNEMAEDVRREIAFLGIEASLSFVREPEGNEVAERFIRTLEALLRWARVFDTLEQLQRALRTFTDRYHRDWPLQRHGHRTPDQVRADQQAEAMVETPPAVAARRSRGVSNFRDPVQRRGARTRSACRAHAVAASAPPRSRRSPRTVPPLAGTTRPSRRRTSPAPADRSNTVSASIAGLLVQRRSGSRLSKVGKRCRRPMTASA